MCVNKQASQPASQPARMQQVEEDTMDLDGLVSDLGFWGGSGGEDVGVDITAQHPSDSSNGRVQEQGMLSLETRFGRSAGFLLLLLLLHHHLHHRLALCLELMGDMCVAPLSGSLRFSSRARWRAY